MPAPVPAISATLAVGAGGAATLTVAAVGAPAVIVAGGLAVAGVAAATAVAFTATAGGLLWWALGDDAPPQLDDRKPQPPDVW